MHFCQDRSCNKAIAYLGIRSQVYMLNIRQDNDMMTWWRPTSKSKIKRERKSENQISVQLSAINYHPSFIIRHPSTIVYWKRNNWTTIQQSTTTSQALETLTPWTSSTALCSPHPHSSIYNLSKSPLSDCLSFIGDAHRSGQPRYIPSMMSSRNKMKILEVQSSFSVHVRSNSPITGNDWSYDLQKLWF